MKLKYCFNVNEKIKKFENVLSGIGLCWALASFFAPPRHWDDRKNRQKVRWRKGKQMETFQNQNFVYKSKFNKFVNSYKTSSKLTEKKKNLI